MNVTILGAGVSGLTCGVRLLEDGHRVRIVAKDRPQQTTSAVAGAVWFPYRVAPNDRTGPWARASYERFTKLDQAPISMVELTMLYPDPLREDPWWLAAIPGGRARRSREKELPPQYADGIAAQVPCIEAPAYLDWLEKRFTEQGGTIDHATVTNPDALPGDVVVNCPGATAADTQPVRGQVAYVKTDKPLRFMVDEEGPNALAYVLPRPDVTVLGGTAEPGDDDLTPRQDTTKDILERTAKLQPAIKEATLLGTAVGLRPARAAVRLEREDRVIHNYGHGGSGFTLSWGCADEVAALLDN